MFSYLVSLKGHSPCVLSVKLLIPLGFEIDGIHQVELNKRTDCPSPQYLWYLTYTEYERKLLLLGENKLFLYKHSLNIEKRLESCLSGHLRTQGDDDSCWAHMQCSACPQTTILKQRLTLGLSIFQKSPFHKPKKISDWHWGFPDGWDSKESACNVGDPGSVPGFGRSPGKGNGNPVFLPGESHGQRRLAG